MEMGTKTALQFHFAQVRMAKIKKTKDAFQPWA